jgi:hypothetical protein
VGEALFDRTLEHKVQPELVKTGKSTVGGLRDRAIAEYHEQLAADETLTHATFEKLRSAMRKKRLLYGNRPIGVSLRPHLLHHTQFQKLTRAAQLVTSALEKVAAAVVEDANLMEELGSQRRSARWRLLIRDSQQRA